MIVASSSLRTQCFMIAQSILRSGIMNLKDCVQKGIVNLPNIPIEEQTIDILAKALARGSFVIFRDKLGVVQNPFIAKRNC